MSASEKLKALEKLGAFGRWSLYEEPVVSGGDTYWHRWIAEDDYPSADGRLSDGVLLDLSPDTLSRQRAEMLVGLRNALPQIIAVVEAAERMEQPDAPDAYMDWAPLANALAKLAELEA